MRPPFDDVPARQMREAVSMLLREYSAMQNFAPASRRAAPYLSLRPFPPPATPFSRRKLKRCSLDARRTCRTPRGFSALIRLPIGKALLLKIQSSTGVSRVSI